MSRIFGLPVNIEDSAFRRLPEIVDRLSNDQKDPGDSFPKHSTVVLICRECGHPLSIAHPKHGFKYVCLNCNLVADSEKDADWMCLIRA